MKHTREQLEQMDYDVYLHHDFKKIGTQSGPTWGGVVSHPNGHDVVGVVQFNPQTKEYFLRADQPHHTGRQWDGEKVSVDSRPSKNQ